LICSLSMSSWTITHCFELHSQQMPVYLLQADPSLLPEVEEDVMAECTKIGPIDRLRVSVTKVYCCWMLHWHRMSRLSIHATVYTNIRHHSSVSSSWWHKLKD
jgi:hypothetical protein